MPVDSSSRMEPFTQWHFPESRIFIQIIDSRKFYCSNDSTFRTLRTEYLENLVQTYDLRSHLKYFSWMILGNSVPTNVRAKVWLRSLFECHFYHVAYHKHVGMLIKNIRKCLKMIYIYFSRRTLECHNILEMSQKT